MRVTYYRLTTDAYAPVPLDLSWDALAADLMRYRPISGDKMAAPAWSPVYLTAPHRLSANVGEVCALVLDFDDGAPVAESWATWEGHARLMYTTWSHGPGCPKYRIVLPLARPVPGAWWKTLYRSILEGGGREADAKCIDPARLFYLPCIGAGGDHETAREDGEWLDLYDTADGLWREEQQARAEREQAARRRVAQIEREVKAGGGDDARVRRQLFGADPDARRRLAEHVGAAIAAGMEGEIARHAPCPACGRRDVWWGIGRGWARCNHIGSCGYAAHLSDYAAAIQ